MNWLESQIETRSRLDAELNERAYVELAASVSRPSDAPRYNPGNLEQTDTAVRDCLHYLGIEPGDVTDDITEIYDRLDIICRPSGTMYRMVELTSDWYKHAAGAMLGTLDTGESIALIPRGIRGYFYYEPGSHRKVKVNAQTAKHIQSEAMFFYQGLPQKPLTVRDFVAFLARICNLSDYILVLIAGLAATFAGFIPVWANKIAFGVVVPSGQVDLIMPIGAMLVGVSISIVLITIIQNLIMSRVSQKLDLTSQAAVFARVLTLPASFFKEYASGNLAMRISQTSALTQRIASVLLGSGFTAVLSILYITQIAVYAPSLAIPAFIVVLVQAAAIVGSIYAETRYQRIALEKQAHMSGTETALLYGVTKLKLAGAENRAFAKWAHDYAAYAQAEYRHPSYVRALQAILVLIGMIGGIAIYWFAGTSQVSIDSYMAFNVAFGEVTAAFMILAGLANEIALIWPAMDQLIPVLEATPEVAEDKPLVGTLSGAIEVSDVSFKYTPDSPYIVENLSFKVKPGEYVALVGKSGCGKSTIMRILLGFEQPERGTVFYGPYNVARVDQRSLRRAIGTVMQDGKLFMGTIESNITISTPAVTTDDAWEAAELAGIADDIRKMPMGMQTLVSEGAGGVSGGQRQRIMIARAICGKRKILMFDEATSALDNKTQKHVSDSLDQLKCTRVVVAHRLSTVRHCDRILVVDGGRIAEEGTYDQLIERNGLFAELVARQRLES